MFGAEKTRGVKRLERADLARALDGLPDGDEGRDVRVPGTEGSRDDGADVRHRHRLRRDIAGVPVVLVPRVQDEAEIGGVERAYDRSAVDDAADLFQPLRELDVVDGGVDRRERAQHVLDVHARLERRIALRIERFRLRHAAGHPQNDDRVGRAAFARASARQAAFAKASALQGLGVGGLPAGERREGPGSCRAHEPATAHARVNPALLGGQCLQFVRLWGRHIHSFSRSVGTRASSTGPTAGQRVHLPMGGRHSRDL